MTLSIVLIDGEHYPAVIARAVAALRDQGQEPVLALLIGGGEKVEGLPQDIGVRVEEADDPEADLAAAITRTGATRVIDLSDDPVLRYRARCRLACVAAWKGAEYTGADFTFRPPPRDLKPSAPSIAVIGSGKRSGKTAVASAVARALRDAGMRPVAVAMGRGGPAQPEVIENPPAPETLVGWADQGLHAASDYVEIAIAAQIPTVGSWRAGGGLAGAPGFSNYRAALEKAAGLAPGILVLDGSGAAIPPAAFDAAILAVDAGVDPEYICGYFGLYRALMADLVLLTMVENSIDPRNLAAVEDCLSSRPGTKPKTIRTVFRPHPIGDISKRKVWMATTARQDAGNLMKDHLETRYGAHVVGISNSLADRSALRRDLGSMGGADVLAVEIKAAGVDMAARAALDAGMEVVYLDNRPVAVDGANIESAFVEVAQEAKERFAK